MIRLITLLYEVLAERAPNSSFKNSEALDRIFSSTDLPPNTLERRTTNGRITNLGGMSTAVFKTLLAKIFEVSEVEVKVHKPETGPNPSRQFDGFEFPVGDGTAFIILAGKGSKEKERQEIALLDIINSVEGEKTLVFNKGRKIEGVLSAKKAPRILGYRYEPIIDLIITTTKGELGISAKGLQTPTIGGGGLTGVDILNIAPLNEIVEELYQKTFNEYKEVIDANPELEKKNLQKNRNFPDAFKKIPPEIVAEVLTGSKKLGGEVDFFYVGSLEVVHSVVDKLITIEGDLLEVSEMALIMTPVYLRIAKRDGPLYFTKDYYSKLKNLRIPLLLTNISGGMKAQTRLFITNKNKKSKPLEM